MPDAKILIIEDESIEAMDIQQRLVRLGYPLPDTAYTGAEGVRKVEELRPDLVLMDIMMPGELDGVAAAERIRSRFDIPIIFLTAYADEKTLRRARITAPYGYIVKPFQERELHITVDMALYRHKTEKELHEREKWLATTLRSIGDAVIATDEKGLITFMNPVAEALLGFKLEEVRQRNLTEVFIIVNRDTRRPVENPVTRVLREGNIVGLANHTVLISRDGSEIPINDSAAPIKDDQGSMLGVILVFSDMTEREKAAESLRESQRENEFLAGLIRASSQPVAIGYPDGRLGLFNRAFEELTGYAADELRSVNWATALTPPEWLEMERDKLAELHRTGQSVRYEKEYIRKNGTRVPVELLVHVVSDAEGMPQYYYAFLTELTERRQAEEKVIKLNEELRQNVAELSVANTSLRDSRRATLNMMEDALAARKRAEETNTELQGEIDERKKAEEALRESELRVRRKLESVLSPEGDIGNLELGDIIDPPALQSLVDNLYKFVRLPVGIIDLKGNVLVGVGWQEVCTKFHRIHPDTGRHCTESDLELTRGVSPGEFKLYKCKNGMWDAVTPLIVGGQHMGNLFWGQFFFDDEPVDREFFRAQARKYGFDEEEYLAALDNVPRISREALDTGMAFYLRLADVLSKLSYGNIKLSQTLSVRDTLLHSLRESEERLKRAQEISHLGSWELDLVNNALTWSDEVYRIFGLKPQEFGATYEAFLEAIHPDDRAAVDAAYAGSLREGRDAYEIEHRVVRKATGEIRYVHEKCRHFRDESGGILKSVGMVQDITERKKAEAELLKLSEDMAARNLELESVNRELEAFIYSVSHDLRAPLRSVSGFSKAVVEDYSDKLDAQGRDYLVRIRDGSIKMTRLIDDLLHLSKISRQEIAHGRVDLSGMVSSLVAELRKTGPERGIEAEIKEGVTAFADHGLMRIVLENLIGNSWKFTAKTQKARIEFGTIDCGTRNAECGLKSESTPPKPGIVYYVRDNGAGFDQAYADKMFRPFQRLHSDREFEGMGIGLSIVERVIRRHGGRVWAEGEPGKGATVYFTLG
jgi:PAS domain S-box-containing protein